jgi:uncharacterized DUF497 family protein
MVFEWDPGKAKSNAAKHAIDFADCGAVFYDDHAITIDDEHPNEDRFVTIGSDSLGRVVAVAYCWRGDRIRIISARRATRHERAQYEEYR